MSTSRVEQPAPALEVGDVVFSVACDADGLPIHGGMVVDAGVVDGLAFYEVLVRSDRQRVLVYAKGNKVGKPHAVVGLRRMFTAESAKPEVRIDTDKVEPIRDPDGYFREARIQGYVMQVLMSAALAPYNDMLRLVVVAGELLQLRRDEIEAEKVRLADRSAARRVEDERLSSEVDEELAEWRRARAEAQ